MIPYVVATKVLVTEIFPQHTIAGLDLWHYIYCSVQSEEAFMVKGNKHTHTHTHTQTQTQAQAHTHTLTHI